MGMTIYLYVCFGLLLANLVILTSGQSCRCSDQKHGSKTFHACNCKKTWPSAQSFCALLFTGGQLAVIPDKATQDVVSIFLRNEGLEDTWIGGRSVKRDWHWVPGNDTLSGQGCFTDTTFARDLPQSRDISSLTPEACISRCRTDGFKYAGVQGGTGCYCGNSYGQYGLGSPCNAWCSGDSSTYCGGSDINYVYNVNGVYSQWASTGHPDSVSLMQSQNCMVLSCQTLNTGDEVWSWKPSKCSVGHKSLCDYPLDQTTCTSRGYKWASGKCFSFKENTYRSWFEARQACLNNSGDLLVVKDEATHKAIIKQLQCAQSTFWIAGSRTSWTWSTGDKFSYTSWATDSPSDTGTEKCLTMSFKLSQDYLWGDSDCRNEVLTFLCQSEKKTIPTTPTTTTSTTPTPSTTTPRPTTSTTPSPPPPTPRRTTTPIIVPTPSPSDNPSTKPLTTQGRTTTVTYTTVTATTVTDSIATTGKPQGSTRGSTQTPLPPIDSSTKSSTKPPLPPVGSTTSSLSPDGSTKSPLPPVGSTTPPLPPDGSTIEYVTSNSSSRPSTMDVITKEPEKKTTVAGGPGGPTQRGPLEGSALWIGVGLGILVFISLIIIVGVYCKRRNKEEKRKPSAVNVTVSDSSQFILKGQGGAQNGFRKDSEFAYIDVRHDAPLKASGDKVDNPSAPNNMSAGNMNNTPIDLTTKYTNLNNLMGEAPPKQGLVMKNTNQDLGQNPYITGGSSTPPESINPADFDSFVYESERGTSEAPSIFMDDTGSIDSGHPGYIGALDEAVYVNPRSDDDDDVIIIPTNEVSSDPPGANTENGADSGIILLDGTVDQAGEDDDCYTRL